MPKRFNDEFQSLTAHLTEEHIDTHHRSIETACKEIAPRSGFLITHCIVESKPLGLRVSQLMS